MAVENQFRLTLDPALASANFTVWVYFEVVAQAGRAGFEYIFGRIERHASD
jgi:hypothetical protein